MTQLQRKAKPEAAETGSAEADADNAQRIAVLEQQVEQLEAQLEALQDSIHRQAVRYGKEFEALEHRTSAPEMARALGKYSQERRL